MSNEAFEKEMAALNAEIKDTQARLCGQSPRETSSVALFRTAYRNRRDVAV